MRLLLHATAALDKGTGIGSYSDQLIRHLAPLAAERGHELVLWHNSLRRSGEPLRGYGVPLRSTPAAGWAASRLWPYLDLPPGEWLTGSADLVHGPNFFTPPMRRARRVATIHDLTAVKFPQWHNRTVQAYGPYLRRTARHQDLILADSEATWRDIIELLAVPDDRVRVVPLAAAPAFRPVAPTTVAETLARLRLPTPYLLHVGSFEPRKNLLALMDAFERSKSYQDVHLVLAGSAGWNNAEILARAASLSPRVHIAGGALAADLPAIYSGALGLVYPSLYEGFGLPPLEAMSCGTPVACSNVASLPEVVGDAALTFPPGDVEAIPAAIDALVSDSLLRARLRERGLRQAARFSWKRTAERTLEAYESLA